MTTLQKRPPQCNRILKRLQSQEGQGWVSASELAGISLQYCARVNELRKQGWAIANKVEVQTSGAKRGYYRLRPLPCVTVSYQDRSFSTAMLPANDGSGCLFGDISADTTYRE